LNLSEARVLLVDDEPILLEIISNWLLSVGWGTVFTAANGKAALALLEMERIDLLLTDVRMPVMDGVTLVRRLGAMRHVVPSIIFVSGFGDVDRREMYGLGVEAFIGKPFDRMELVAALERAVADRSTLWRSELVPAPLQSMLIEADHIEETASLHTIGLGRGGFSVCSPQPLSSGKVAFRLRLADAAIEITGQGHIRWSSQAEGKAGIEIAFLDPESRAALLRASGNASPRSFIPGS
jgi:CheY-like chemotaxis protein